MEQLILTEAEYNEVLKYEAYNKKCREEDMEALKGFNPLADIKLEASDDLYTYKEDIISRFDGAEDLGISTNEMFANNELFMNEDVEAKPTNDEDEEVIILHMDIREPIKKLRALLEDRLGVNLNKFEFWLQDAQLLEPHKNLVDQCVKGEGLVQINAQVWAHTRRINIIDVLKPTDDALAEISDLMNQTTATATASGSGSSSSSAAATTTITTTPPSSQNMDDMDDNEIPDPATIAAAAAIERELNNTSDQPTMNGNNVATLPPTTLLSADPNGTNEKMDVDCDDNAIVNDTGADNHKNGDVDDDDDGGRHNNITDDGEGENSNSNTATAPTNKPQWIIDTQFKKDQQRLKIADDPKDWTIPQVKHWLQWAVRQFNLTNIKLQDWCISGSDLFDLSIEKFRQKVPQDPDNIFWTHLELLRRLKVVAVQGEMIENDDPNEDSNGPTIVPKVNRTLGGKQNVQKIKQFGQGTTTAPLGMISQFGIEMSQQGNRTGNNGQIQLWQFLLEILTDREHTSIISWQGYQGEFKLTDPELVAQLWGLRKNKPTMNYEKLSRALRYYYDGDMISKVPGKRFVYKFVCDLTQLIGYNAQELSNLVNSPPPAEDPEYP